MSTSIRLKKSSISGRIPASNDLEYGELAINYADGIIYFKNSSNTIQSINATPSGIDSTATINLIDSAYIETRRPAETVFSIVNNGSSAYTFSGDGFPSTADNPTIYLTRGKTYKFSINASGHPFQIRLSSGGSAYSDGVTNNGAQSGDVIFTVPMNAPNTLVYQCTVHSGMVGSIKIFNEDSFFDSSEVISLIDSAYIQERQVDLQRDSSFVTNIIDSSYVQDRQIKYTNADFADSSFVTTQINNLIDGAPGTLDTLNEIAAALNDDDSAYNTLIGLINAKSDLDSADAITLIDSAYVQARQTTSPTGVDSAATIALIDSAYVLARAPAQDFLDSSEVIDLIDSAYVQARQSSTGSGSGLDSAAVVNIIDSEVDQTFINNLNVNASTLGGNSASYYLDYNNFTNTPSGGVDYGSIIVQATNAIDLLIAAFTVDYGTATAPAGLKSDYGTI